MNLVIQEIKREELSETCRDSGREGGIEVVKTGSEIFFYMIVFTHIHRILYRVHVHVCF